MSEQSAAIQVQPTPARLSWQVGVATFSRLVINTARRFVYTFAPVLSRGLGVPLTAITTLIAINQATGLLSPFFGPLGDRWGYRVMLLAGLGLLTVGMLAGGLLPFYLVLIISLCLAGLGKSIFDPALQAYIGERVPFTQRGRVIGIIEFGWAGSVLVGVPLIGLLIDQFGWRAPFFVLAGLGLLGFVALQLLITPGEPRQGLPVQKRNFSQTWRLLRQSRAAVGTLGYSFLISLGNDTLFVIYGVWLEERFALTVIALGTATIVIGAAELLGEILTATIADRLNLKRAVIGGLICSIGSYLLLPLLSHTLPLALLGLFLIFLTLEFTIVTAISLFTEILPEARGTILSAHVATNSLGRVVGASIGGLVWLAGGLTAVSFVAAGASSLALVCLVWGLRSWRPHHY